ncbi:hypothetical protein UFOVP1537_45 [uncultured Caudovirales phage]|uniref:Uncharacterized protein n=2 Tax=root TaxID=1 RepID=A0A6J5PIL3_9CAUD|nr:hypothetical protein UFOVP825_10 [uncultured Caudovirales phage]CAB4171323.1 hypothetical protein UFOVP915_45 [uncultured Caudovirales phage]CAB4177192.1 hypothetical protein UFOVP1000_9 [uncultured Caudovirales phage]CAB4183116.1 hypothetical protein UFOVP1092_37 [uncultured Caudovirales phage]CAB4187651.1 hypothetical protein UFOVP1152_41 [uncultured Caudovirales phage]
MMTIRRTEEGLLEVSHKALGVLVIVFTLANALFAAGGAYMSVRSSIDKKVDKDIYNLHVEDTRLAFQRFQFADSIQAIQAHDDRQRLREIVCYNVVAPSCR